VVLDQLLHCGAVVAAAVVVAFVAAVVVAFVAAVVVAFVAAVVVAFVAAVVTESFIVHGVLGTQRPYFLRAFSSPLAMNVRKAAGSPLIITTTRYCFVVLSCRPRFALALMFTAM